MKFASFTLALVLTLALAGAAPAWPGRGLIIWQPAPTTVGGTNYYYSRSAYPRQSYAAVPYSEFAAQEECAASEDRAYINVQMPSANAKLWINDRLMIQSGRERSFMTPALGSAERNYSFEVKASWIDDLGPRTQQVTIQVRGGESRTLVFPMPSK